MTGFGFGTKNRIKVGTELQISLHNLRNSSDITGNVVRAFSESIDDDEIIYGVELDEEKFLKKFLQQYILSFSAERLERVFNRFQL